MLSLLRPITALCAGLLLTGFAQATAGELLFVRLSPSAGFASAGAYSVVHMIEVSEASPAAASSTYTVTLEHAEEPAPPSINFWMLY